MRVAINGYFWDQPRTGSGQYLRHLRRALSELPTASELDLTVLVPGGADDGRWTTDDEAKDAGSSNPIVHRPSSIVRRRLPTPLAKTSWETWGIMTEARRRGAVLLHVPYFSAPLARQIPVVVTAHDMIP